MNSLKVSNSIGEDFEISNILDNDPEPEERMNDPVPQAQNVPQRAPLQP